MRGFLFLGLMMATVMSAGAQQTKILSAEKHNEYGLVYTLPTTAFDIEVIVVKEIRKAGPFYKYASKFAGETEVVKEDAVSFNIESIKVKPYGIPNPESRYLMQLKPGSTTYIGVSDDGMLLSINKQPKESIPEVPSNLGIEGTPSTGKEYLDYVNEDFISAQSSFKQAQLLAEELMEIRDAKISLTRGTAESMPTDGRQLELMLASLDNQEKALMQAFTGNIWRERLSRTFTFVPDEENRYVLCRLSDFNGLVDADDYSGDPVYISVKLIETPELPVDGKGEEKKLPKDAVVYCIPGTAELNISFSGKPLFVKSFPMSQFGMTFGLNPTLFTDRKEASYAIFDPSTGALVELGVSK